MLRTLPSKLLNRANSTLSDKAMEVFRQFQGLQWCKPDWCFPSMSKETDDLLRSCRPHEPQSPQELEQVIAASEAFPILFPVQSVRLSTLNQTRPADRLMHNVQSTYPLIHERVVLLITHFLIFKREFGTVIEKAMYKDMDIEQFISRLLNKRAITFMTAKDKYKLITGEEGFEGWETVGTNQEKPPLTLDRVLSYDEQKVSSLLFVSGHSEFINDGARNNMGVPAQEGFETTGVVIGLIGPRLKRTGRMEHEDLLLSPQQNTLDGGYGEATPTTCLDVLRTSYVRGHQSARHMWRQMWSEFYQVPSLTYEEVTSSSKIPRKQDDKQKYTDRYVRLDHGEMIFDNEVYYKRLSVSFDCALLDANERAKRQNKMAYLNMVGIGLGVWRMSSHQNDVFVLTLLERVRSFLRRGQLNYVADVNMAYIRPTDSVMDIFSKEEGGDRRNNTARKLFIECKKHPLGGINVQLEKREPQAKLPADLSGRLLVVTYPWDGNAHPGNEFWLGSLASSGDPAAAASTQVAELHNAAVNRAVSGGNTRVATANGVVTLHEYCSGSLAKA